MKVFNLTNLCFVLVLAIGMTAAWTVATPGEMSDSKLIHGAGSCDCSGTKLLSCSQIFPNGENCEADQVRRKLDGSTGNSSAQGQENCGATCGEAFIEDCQADDCC